MRDYKLTEELFLNPPAEFRGAPFWSWNNKLDKNQLKHQITYFKEMGMGGFHIHCRVGLDTEYLGKEYMECVKECVEEGKKLGLKTYLYDEDRWPSGAAGGIVTKEVCYRSRYLYFIPQALVETDKDYGKLLKCFKIKLNEGFLESYEEVEPSQKEDGNYWYLYMQIAQETPWFNNQTYLDTLNPKAVERFIAVTHEAYYQLLGEDFGSVIPSIFTDEPQFQMKETLDFANEKKSLILPYTDEFEDFYTETYGESFLDHFPEVVWEIPNGEISKVRYQYHDGIAELFAKAFADTLGHWCEDHEIQLTGHMMEEPTLLSQTKALGEAMRSYRGFQLPGIDILCDWREYTTAKQAQSASHQYGRNGVLSELYGVTNWDFDFRNHKLQGDWQAALGVTRRVHHLSWVSMAGESKRDYPASIFYQSPWYKEYRIIEDHFARVNTAMMKGSPRVKIAVIHPIETYWLHFGPKDQTLDARVELEQHFQNVTEWLLFGQIDFDYISESLLRDQDKDIKDGKLRIGAMTYDAVVIPGCETLRNTTWECIKEFQDLGGDVIFLGKRPKYIDGKKEELWQEEQCGRQIPMVKTELMQALAPYRDMEIRCLDGTAADHLLYQMREDGENRWMFLANGKKVENPDVPDKRVYEIRLSGVWDIELYDTLTGRISKLKTDQLEKSTVFRKNLDLHDSLLIKMTPAAIKINPAFMKKQIISYHKDIKIATAENSEIPQPVGIELSEPNTLLLDQAEYRLDGGNWRSKEEILKIDHIIREELGYPKRMDAWAQPWVEKEDRNQLHLVELKFSIESKVDSIPICLALEELEKTKIYWNDIQIIGKSTGWYIDECLSKVELGELKKGRNELKLSIQFGRKTDLEWCYLLGKFGVRVMGKDSYITKYPKTVKFGNYVTQLLPFYTGNLRYNIKLMTDAGNYLLQMSKYRSPLLKVILDGKEKGNVIYSPYELDLGYMEAGVHDLEIIAYGNRFNAFGALHNCDEAAIWHGPDAWRSEGERYSYEYQLKRMGVLKTPVLKKYS